MGVGTTLCGDGGAGGAGVTKLRAKNTTVIIAEKKEGCIGADKEVTFDLTRSAARVCRPGGYMESYRAHAEIVGSVDRRMHGRQTSSFY